MDRRADGRRLRPCGLPALDLPCMGGRQAVGKENAHEGACAGEAGRNRTSLVHFAMRTIPNTSPEKRRYTCEGQNGLPTFGQLHKEEVGTGRVRTCVSVVDQTFPTELSHINHNAASKGRSRGVAPPARTEIK